MGSLRPLEWLHSQLTRDNPVSCLSTMPLEHWLPLQVSSWSGMADGGLVIMSDFKLLDRQMGGRPDV